MKIISNEASISKNQRKREKIKICAMWRNRNVAKKVMKKWLSKVMKKISKLSKAKMRWQRCGMPASLKGTLEAAKKC